MKYIAWMSGRIESQGVSVKIANSKDEAIAEAVRQFADPACRWKDRYDRAYLTVTQGARQKVVHKQTITTS